MCDSKCENHNVHGRMNEFVFGNMRSVARAARSDSNSRTMTLMLAAQRQQLEMRS